MRLAHLRQDCAYMHAGQTARLISIESFVQKGKMYGARELDRRSTELGMYEVPELPPEWTTGIPDRYNIEFMVPGKAIYSLNIHFASDNI